MMIGIFQKIIGHMVTFGCKSKYQGFINIDNQSIHSVVLRLTNLILFIPLEFYNDS